MSQVWFVVLALCCGLVATLFGVSMVVFFFCEKNAVYNMFIALTRGLLGITYMFLHIEMFSIICVGMLLVLSMWGVNVLALIVIPIILVSTIILGFITGTHRYLDERLEHMEMVS